MKSKKIVKKTTALIVFLFFLIVQICGLIRLINNNNPNPVVYLHNDFPFYVYWKKHFCPKCSEKLVVSYDSVIINSDSPEAEEYEFWINLGDTKLTGDIEFRTCFFLCPKCEFTISFDEMKKYEKENK